MQEGVRRNSLQFRGDVALNMDFLKGHYFYVFPNVVDAVEHSWQGLFVTRNNTVLSTLHIAVPGYVLFFCWGGGFGPFEHSPIHKTIYSNV